MRKTDKLKNELEEVQYFYTRSKEYIQQDINVVFFQKLSNYLIRKQLILSDEIMELETNRTKALESLIELNKEIKRD